MSAAHPLSNLQQELLKLYASNIEDADLLHIKRYLAKYFAEKAIKEADRIWDEKGYTNETMDQWLNDDDKSGKKNKGK
jgi:predicted transcriptional regulator